MNDLTGEFVDGQTIGHLTGEFVDGQTIGQLNMANSSTDRQFGQTIIGQHTGESVDGQTIGQLTGEFVDGQKLVNSLAGEFIIL